MTNRLHTTLSNVACAAVLGAAFAASSTPRAHAAPPYLLKDLDSRATTRLEAVLAASEEGTRSTSVATGQTRASSMTLGLDPASDGWITVRLFGAETADVILDVSGYFK